MKVYCDKVDLCSTYLAATQIEVYMFNLFGIFNKPNGIEQIQFVLSHHFIEYSNLISQFCVIGGFNQSSFIENHALKR